jgi:hypothetical protein
MHTPSKKRRGGDWTDGRGVARAISAGKTKSTESHEDDCKGKKDQRRDQRRIRAEPSCLDVRKRLTRRVANVTRICWNER